MSKDIFLYQELKMLKMKKEEFYKKLKGCLVLVRFVIFALN